MPTADDVSMYFRLESIIERYNGEAFTPVTINNLKSEIIQELRYWTETHKAKITFPVTAKLGVVNGKDYTLIFSEDFTCSETNSWFW